MLEKYLNGKKERLIPYAYGRYRATLTGKIIDDYKNMELTPDENGKVKLLILDKCREVSVLWLLAATFKPLFEAETFIEKWNVILSDDESLDLIARLIWIPPTGGQPCPKKPDFNVIPFFSKYCISKNGLTWNRETNCYLKERKAIPRLENTYLNINVKPDGFDKGLQVLGVHRAVGLAWIPYSNNIFSLIINHKDGNKYNNYCGNVKWVTYSENNKHALDSGLRGDKRPVSVKNHITNTIINYESLTTAAKELFVSTGHLHWMINEKKIIKSFFSAQYTNELTVWPCMSEEEISETYKYLDKKSDDLFCGAYNVITGLKYISDSPVDIQRIIGFNKTDTHTAFDSNSKWPYKGWVCYRRSRPKEIYKIDPLIAEKLKHTTVSTNPVLVYKNNELLNVYKSITVAAEAMNVDRQKLTRLFRLGNETVSIDGFTFTLYKPTETILLTF